MAGFWGLSRLFRMSSDPFDHPYIFILHGRVLCAGIAGKKKKEAVEVGTLGKEVLNRLSYCEKVRNPLSCWAQWWPVGAEGLMEAV